MRPIWFALSVLLTTAASATAESLPNAPHIYVEGSAEIRVEPDILNLAVAIEAVNPDLGAAKADADSKARKLIASCKSLGIKDEDISSANLVIGPAYEYRDSERHFIGTRVHRDIEVVLRTLDQYPALIQAVVTSGVAEITSTTLSSSKARDLIDRAQLSALSDARDRAERLAAGAGQALASVYSISEFDLRGDRYFLFPSRRIGKRERPETASLGAAADVSDPFEPGLIVASATVYVTYLIEPK